MFDALYHSIEQTLGLGVEELLLMHMVSRVLMVYVAGIFILNVINKRFIGENTPFDIILRFIIGSSLANAIVGSSPFWPTLGMVFFIVLLNWFLSLLSFYSRFIEKILKSEPHNLFHQGKFMWKAMKKYHVTQEDILSEVRKDSGLASLDDVAGVILEGSGEFSVIPKPHTRATNHHKIKQEID